MRKPVLMTKFRIFVFLPFLKGPCLNYMIPRFGTDTTILYIILRRLNSVSSVLISTTSNDVNVMRNVMYVVRRTG